MKLVSSLSDEEVRKRDDELKRKQAEAERERVALSAEWALKELAANVARIIRGAGHPHKLIEQMHKSIVTMKAYADLNGEWPSDFDIHKWLDAERPREKYSDDARGDYAYGRDFAERVIHRGVLQIVASRLVQQLPQERTGENEFSSGLRLLATAEEDYKQRLRAQEEAARTGKPRTPRKRDEVIL